MIVRNEETRLERCLMSVLDYVDEIIVVDTGSTDQTKRIAAKCGAKVYDYTWNDHFADARNFGLSLSNSDWNLILDADEYVVNMDLQAVQAFMNNDSRLGRIEVISHLIENGIPYDSRGYITRLLPSSVRFKGRIHEQVESNQLRIKIPITVFHDGYLDTNKSSRNIPLLLKEVAINPDDSYINYQLGKEFQGIKDIDTACKYYKRAYDNLTGIERFAPNVAVQYIYALKEKKQFADAMELINHNHQWLLPFPDYHFACGFFYLDLILSNPIKYSVLLPEIEAAYRRCLAIGETDCYDSVVGHASYIALYNLGVFYEIFGNIQEAATCYKESSELGYEMAKTRLDSLQG